MKSSDDVIKEEIELVLQDIIKLYQSENKKVSGDFEENLEAVYEPNKATIRGFTYLAGRRAGKMPPSKALEEWVKRKGIFAIKSQAEVRSIAFLIARKIAQEGTAKKYHLKVYEEVLTPQRINSIISKVSELNVNRIITTITAELEVLQKNI